MNPKDKKRILKDAQSFLKPPPDTITLYRIINNTKEDIFFGIGKTIAGYLNPILKAYTCEKNSKTY